MPNNWVAIRGTLACLWNPAVQEHGTLRPRALTHQLTTMLGQTGLVNANLREFYIALAFICLHAVCNIDLPQHIRRVQFLLAAYAFMKYEEQRGT
jgi:hypothetical protein